MLTMFDGFRRKMGVSSFPLHFTPLAALSFLTHNG
jgi:hypothetical protein